MNFEERYILEQVKQRIDSISDELLFKIKKLVDDEVKYRSEEDKK